MRQYHQLQWRPLFQYLLVLTGIVCFSSCAGMLDIHKDLSSQLEAESLISSLKAINEGIQTVKGIGKVTVSNQNELLSARVAWMGTHSGKFRIEVMGLMGQTLMSLSTDGMTSYFLSYKPQRFMKNPSSDIHFQSILSIPVKSDEIVMILSGRIPIRSYTYAFIEKDADETVNIVNLKSWWGNLVQKLSVDRSQMLVKKIEFFSEGSFEYSVSFFEPDNVESYRLPFRIDFVSHDGNSLNLTVSKYWADAPVNDSAFELHPPAENQSD